MVKITYIEHGGQTHEVEAKPGETVMEIAVKRGVPGIDADCGGGLACATCQVYVEPEWIAAVGGPSQAEELLLEFAPGCQENSRLSCQIALTEDLDGLVVRLPETQR